MMELFNISNARFLKLLLAGYNVFFLAALFLLFLWKDNLKKKSRLPVINAGIRLSIGFLFVQYALFAYAQFIEPNWVKIERVRIGSENLPPENERIKIVHLSDLHVKSYGFRERVMVRITNGYDPDLILITGDLLIDSRGIDVLKKTLSELKAKKGIFVILGDNDFYAMQDTLELKIALDNIGVRVLDNESVRVPIDEKKGIWIMGLSTPENAAQNNPLRKVLSEVMTTEPRILLTHYPETVDSDYINDRNVDLILSGGTHGGQIGLPVVREFLKKTNNMKYISGLYRVNNVPLYVNRGLASVGDMNTSTVRFLCRPEITFLTLAKD